jgi:hypothetical protein
MTMHLRQLRHKLDQRKLAQARDETHLFSHLVLNTIL